MSYFGISLRNGLGLGLGTTPSLTNAPLSYKLAPSLNLQFAGAETLDPRITFTRSTTATFTGSNGLIQTAAINAPRFGYDPVTLAPLGLLIEEQRVNLVLNSATLVTQIVTVAAVAHTLSFYGTGTVTISGTFIGSLVGTGAYPTRSTLTFTPTAGAITLTVTGSVTMAQLEAGAFPTSYIPTVASQVTRTTDNAVMTGTNFSSWYNATEGTLLSEGQVDTNRSTAGAVRHTANITPELNSDSGLGFFINGAATFENTVRNSTLVEAQLIVGTNTGAVFKIAGAYQVNNFAFSANGGAPVTDTSGAVPTTPAVTQMKIGGGRGGAAGGQLNGYVRRITFYPRRLANAELQAITK